MTREHENLRLHCLTPVSYANGPGPRAVVWVQGCTLRCPGCFNPETHPPGGGRIVPTQDVLDRLLALDGTVEGVTILGGEPLQQYEAVVSLLKGLKTATDLSVLLFTGYTWEEVLQMRDAKQLLAQIDVLFAGRYHDSQRLARGLRGSANKTVHFLTSRYSPADLEQVPVAEVIIDAKSEVVLTGIDPLVW